MVIYASPGPERDRGREARIDERCAHNGYSSLQIKRAAQKAAQMSRLIIICPLPTSTVE